MEWIAAGWKPSFLGLRRHPGFQGSERPQPSALPTSMWSLSRLERAATSSVKRCRVVDPRRRSTVMISTPSH
jgi:hypothetical protein